LSGLKLSGLKLSELMLSELNLSGLNLHKPTRGTAMTDVGGAQLADEWKLPASLRFLPVASRVTSLAGRSRVVVRFARATAIRVKHAC
jgi:hypothetical protein